MSKVARLLANPARAAMVAALMDGRSIPAGELASIAGVGPSTASEHLAELVGGGLILMRAQGRHRYFCVASFEVAEALEAFSQICPKTEVRSLRASSNARALSYARTCYDHLAGALGVSMFEGLVAARWLTYDGDAVSVSERGHGRLSELGIDVVARRARRRSFARPCLDWTERRPHLAGSLGAALTALMLDIGWLERQNRRRGLRVTPAGTQQLPTHLELFIPSLEATAAHAAWAGP